MKVSKIALFLGLAQTVAVDQDLQWDQLERVNMNRPKVGASGYIVDVEIEENNEYYGPLYIGTNFEYAHMVYDTTSAWTSVLVASAKGSTMMSEYDPLKS